MIVGLNEEENAIKNEEEKGRKVSISELQWAILTLIVVIHSTRACFHLKITLQFTDQ